MWSGSVFNGLCSAQQITVENNASIYCGQINTTNTFTPDNNFPEVTLIQSNLMFVPGVELMGATIRCTLPRIIPVDTTLQLFGIIILSAL